MPDNNSENKSTPAWF